MDKATWLWIGFFGTVLVLLALDLGIFHRKDHAIGIKESLFLSAFYIAIALLFGCVVWYELGELAGQNYFTGYLIEKSLSMDNIFVISLVFSFFHIPRVYQHRVLFFGILGVIILRAILIGLGAALVENFSWVLYIFAAFLLFTGVKMLLPDDKEIDFNNNAAIAFLRRHIRIWDKLDGHRFFTKQLSPKTNKRVYYVTPLLMTLVVVEFVDIIFAVDSVPAIFAITTDPFIVYTSNIFAILGLRALYFSLDAIIHRFKYLKYALALILIFIGAKVYIVGLFDMNKFPASVSLGITVFLLASGMLFSLHKTRYKKG